MMYRVCYKQRVFNEWQHKEFATILEAKAYKAHLRHKFWIAFVQKYGEKIGWYDV